VRSRNLAGRFGRDAAGTLALRVTFAVCYGVANIFLARILGAADYGSYTFAAAWLTLLGIPTVLGMDRFLVREVATYSVQGAWGQMRGLLRQSNAHVLALSVTTGLLAAAVAWFYSLAFQFDHASQPLDCTDCLSTRSNARCKPRCKGFSM